MNLFRRLKAAWSFWKVEPYTYVEDWTRGDAEFLSDFMTSATGSKLRKRLANRAVQSAVHATLKTSTQYDQGYAGGCRGTSAFIDSHLQISPAISELSQQTNDEEKQDAHAIDRYRP